ncbi:MULTISPECIES: cysteine hydrolase family protein [unclassified Brevibacterium]|uniref:cysteine hydrolase family protein n=1 Tax=unclassified Brevibacterium TaxID=2614124 RepID=UPI0010923238|nr:isochorismatase family cysteine hydrolase [Brevibacterium sp. S22]TGD32558.1 cysteine hydrolase [Brevibacterium sp. S22]
MNNLAHTAIVGIHLQNDVVHAKGAFSGFFAASAAERGVVAKAAKVIDAAHDSRRPVFLTRVGWDPGHEDLVANYPLLQIVEEQRCLTNGTWQTEFLEGIPVADSDHVITHERVSGFSNTRLDVLLRASNVQTLVVFGVATNVSVESTVRAAADLGYQIILVEDACSSTDEGAHSASIASMGLFAEIVTADDIISRF